MNKIPETLRQTAAGLLVLSAAFMIFEPAVLKGAEDTFTISQVVSAEVAFATSANNVAMSPSLGGLTGGTANGGTQFAIISNDTAGYRVTVQASSSVGMIGNASSSNSIPAYVSSVAGVPDYNFTVPVNKAYFGYTVAASTTADLDPSFLTDGSACGVGAISPALAHCWIAATTTPYTIINRTMPTFGTNASSTIYFQVTINANPNPMIPNDTYVATTTLTATAN